MQRNYKSTSKESAFISSELNDSPLSAEVSLFNTMETKDIEGYPNYFVTSDGDVYSKNYADRGYVQILKPSPMPKGYLIVNLSRNKVSKAFTVHRLIAKAFIPNPDNLPQINHKDRIKTHNWSDNLEWCTNSYNQLYEFKCGKIAKRGCEANCSKFKKEEIMEIRSLYQKGKGKGKMNAYRLAEMYNVHPTTINRIVRNIHYL